MTLETVENTVMLLAAVVGLLSALFRYIEAPKRGWFFIAAYFLANLLSSYYWTTYTLVMQSNPDVSAFIAYFGWNVGYIFLLLAVIYMQPRKARHYINPLMFVPIPLNIYQFFIYIQYGGIFNNLWQGILLTATICLCLQTILFYFKTRRHGTHFPFFHTIVFLFSASEYGMWTSSCYDWPSDLQDPYYYCTFLSYILLVLFSWAASKDYEAEGSINHEKTSAEMRFQLVLQAMVSFIVFVGCIGGYYLAHWMKGSIPEGVEDDRVYGMIAIILFVISLFLVSLISIIITVIALRHKPSANSAQEPVTIKRGRLNLVFTLLVTLGLMVFVVTYTSRLFYRVSVSSIIDFGKESADETATSLENYLTVARSTLWVTADTIDLMIKNDEPQEVIRKYIVDQTDNQKKQFDENFTGLYGYVRGDYMDGTNWVPPDDYVPTERDWYKEAIAGQGDTVIVAPYVDAQTHSVVITICKMLSDGKNVAALDVIVNHIQDITEQVRVGGKGYGIIVDNEGTIVAHAEMDKNGENFRDLYGSDLFDAIKETGRGTLDTTFLDKDCTLFVSDVMDQWYVIIVVSDEELYLDVNNQLAVNIVVYMIIYALLSFFYYLGYKNEQAYGKKMEEMKVGRQKQEYEAQVLKLEKHAADEANKAKSSFLADMSHEIRTPINAILGMNEMILRESDNSSISEYARNIGISGNKLLQLINSILDFSKIEDGKMEIVPVSYKLSELISYLVNSITERANAKKLEFNVNIDPSLPTGLIGDDARINQIIMNLLTNAVKYTPEGSVSLRMEAKEWTGNRVLLHVEVKDTGIGIREEDMGRLFESFERLDMVKNRNIEGTGLGMSITTRLLNLMDSELKVKSKYGEGSVFYFDLWQKIEDNTPMGDYKLAAKSGEEKKYSESFHAPEAHILIVDDTQLNITVVVNLLKKTKVRIDTALSGKDAIELASDYDYDLILMDQRMPGMDGTETMNGIRALENGRNRNTPVICLTADAIRGAKERYMAEGFTDFLTKPIQGSVLEQALIKYLPKDKVSLTSDEFKVQEKEGKKNRFYDLLNRAGVDTGVGMDYCQQDEEIYRMVLDAYAEDANERTSFLKDCHDRKDWDNYAVNIHSIKSSSKTIGAVELAELAAELEKASKEKDEETIERGHDRAIELYMDAANAIHKALNSGE